VPARLAASRATAPSSRNASGAIPGRANLAENEGSQEPSNQDRICDFRRWDCPGEAKGVHAALALTAPIARTLIAPSGGKRTTSLNQDLLLPETAAGGVTPEEVLAEMVTSTPRLTAPQSDPVI
jgi:hypothetical protein